VNPLKYDPQSLWSSASSRMVDCELNIKPLVSVFSNSYVLINLWHSCTYTVLCDSLYNSPAYCEFYFSSVSDCICIDVYLNPSRCNL